MPPTVVVVVLLVLVEVVGGGLHTDMVTVVPLETWDAAAGV